MLKKCLAITVLCAASANLCAAATVEVAVDTNNTIPDVVANSILADGEGVDWTAAALVVDLTDGSVYNTEPDSDSPQSAFWPFLPGLEWDSWVGIPHDGTGGISCGGGDLIVGPCNLGGTGQGAARISWFNTAATNTSLVRIANISMSDDAQGMWSLITSFAGGVRVESSGPVINGVMVPEPGMLALMGLGIAGLARRRRHASPKEMTTS